LAGAEGTSPASGNLTVALTFWPSNPALFQTPTTGAPALTPLQVGNAYGLPASQYGAAESYFSSYGLRVLHASADRLALTVQGPAPAVDAAFGTDIVVGRLGSRTVQFPETVPTLPPALAGEVAAVSG